ncbi:MAG: glycosyltransferase, partial [Lacunisphaera sp.]
MNASKTEPSPRVRVFLPTYRRAKMLPRAVASLQAQTMSHWICELHNDDPDDTFPAQLVQQLGDPRIRLVTHERNLGPIATFNLFYNPTTEPFYALLEDDNSWEPRFLERMITGLSAHPQSVLAWCNQSIARESQTGEIIPTGHTVNPVESGDPRLIPWGDLRQVMGARHANGSMVIRSQPGKNYPTPEIPFGCVEAFRERMLTHPLLYVPETLATFTITQTTARRNDHVTWGSALVLLAATFL